MNWNTRYATTRLAHTPQSHLALLQELAQEHGLTTQAAQQHSAQCDFCGSAEAVGAEHQELLRQSQECPDCLRVQDDPRFEVSFGYPDRPTFMCENHSDALDQHRWTQTGPTTSLDDYFRRTCPSCQHNEHLHLKSEGRDMTKHTRRCRTCLDCAMGG